MPEILLLLQHFTLGKERKVAYLIEKDLEEKGIKCRVIPDVAKPVRRLRVYVEPHFLWRSLKTIRQAPEVSRIILVLRDNVKLNLDDICRIFISELRKFLWGSHKISFKVEVKKIKDKIPGNVPSSLEIASYIGERIREGLKLDVNLKDPDIILYFQIKGDRCLLGLGVRGIYAFKMRAIDKDLYRNLVVVFENPVLKYEILDMIRTCVCFDLELRIVRGNRKAIEEAIVEIGGPGKKVRLKYFDSLDDALSDVELAIGLTRYAGINELDIVRILRNFKGRIAVMVGNEYEGLSIEARRKARYLVRLGPEVGFSMRSSVALAYFLGFYTLVKVYS